MYSAQRRSPFTAPEVKKLLLEIEQKKHLSFHTMPPYPKENQVFYFCCEPKDKCLQDKFKFRNAGKYSNNYIIRTYYVRDKFKKIIDQLKYPTDASSQP